MYSKDIKSSQIHLCMKNLLKKSLFVHYMKYYISNYFKWGLRMFRTHFMKTFRNHFGRETTRTKCPYLVTGIQENQLN